MQEVSLRRAKEEAAYTCGDDINREGLVVRRSVSCNSNIETYYSVNLRNFLPTVCLYCGTEDNLLDDNDDYIVHCYQNYSIVRPICRQYRSSGHEAGTWGKKFFKKT